MHTEKDRGFFWLVIGAVVGAIAVFVATNVAGLSVPDWVGALVPTLSAVVFNRIGPTLDQRTASTGSAAGA